MGLWVHEPMVTHTACAKIGAMEKPIPVQSWSVG